MRARITAKPKAAPKPRKLTDMQMLLVEQLKPVAERHKLTIVPELVFAPPRKWRIDVALLDWPLSNAGLAIEIDGGGYVMGRHSRGAGMEADCEKIAAIARIGYRFIRCTPGQVKKGIVIEWIRQALDCAKIAEQSSADTPDCPSPRHAD